MALATVPASTLRALAAALSLAAATVPATAKNTAVPAQNRIWSDVPAQTFNADRTVPADSAARADQTVDSPGKGWEFEGFPVGNGRIGAMVLDDTARERLALNEISLWSGGENAANNGFGYAYGPLSGRDEFGSYQPFADLLIEATDFAAAPADDAENFRRTLSLDDAVARTTFEKNGTKFTREIFACTEPNVITVVWRASKKGKINAALTLSPKHTATISAHVGGNDNRTVGGNGTASLRLAGTLANGLKFAANATILARGGRVASGGGNGGKIPVSYVGHATAMRPEFDTARLPEIVVEGADELVVLVAMHTNYAFPGAKKTRAASAGASALPSTLSVDPAKLAAATIAEAVEAAADVPAMRKKHVAAHRKLFDRCKIDLGTTDAATAALPTAQRLAKYRKTQNDPDLEETLFQFGRYLLISSSRDALPANLQGLWNDKVAAAWACDYHNNINIQEAYWAAETTNLSECHLPLLNFISASAPAARTATKREFGANVRGWTARISQNPWGAGGWKLWNVPVNAWYALHMWEHFQFTQDKEFLKNQAFPMMREACQFWEDRLKTLGRDGNGFTSQDTSADLAQLRGLPAGTLVTPNGWSHEWGPIEDGVAHDRQLVRNLFSDTVEAAKILGKDAAWAKKLAEKRDRIAPDKIAPGGYLQEWMIDRPNMVSGHRHTSHLFAVFPGKEISFAKTPELAAAAKKSLELRGSDADSRRSWSWPWRTALWARLKDGEKAHENIVGLISFNTLPNLLTTHPPFQADGNFAFPAGVAEMLLQSHAGQIELLPAPCKAWKNGSAHGLKARGNITVNFTWKNGKVTSQELLSPEPQTVTLVVNGTKKIVTTKPLRAEKR